MVNMSIKTKKYLDAKMSNKMSKMRLFFATIFLIAYFSLISNSEIVGQSYLYADDSYELKLIDRIVAIVNNDVITLLELKDALAPYVAKVEESDYTSDKKKEIVNQLTQDMLSRMIERKLTDQEAKRVKITVSDREVDEAIERLKQSQLMSQDDLEKALKDDGLSFLEYREKIREE
ncbi:MAG: SurA N-terminal domain-containing protein, partial [Desulfamplus sp.]|nr:SurA N-terminal domain-containing protein [Desulfamplus sp.]